YRDNAGAANPGHENPIGLGADRRDHGPSEVREILLVFDLGLPWAAATHRDQGRAKTIEAGKILVAARLVDHPLAAEFGFERLHRNAIGFDAAIAAAFADEFVDEDALGRVRHLFLFAAAAFFRRAGLIVNEHRDAGNASQLALHAVEFVAVLDGQSLRPLRGGRIFARLVGHNDDAIDVLGGGLPGDHVHREVAVEVLPAGHRHGVIEKYLVGDVDTGGDGEADRE